MVSGARGCPMATPTCFLWLVVYPQVPVLRSRGRNHRGRTILGGK